MLAGLEDLLHPHVRDPARAQPLEVAGRIGEAVGMIDPKPLDDTLFHKLESFAMGELEDVGILLPHADELVDVEEPAPDVEDLRIRPVRVLVDARHVVRHDVENHVETRRAQAQEFRLTAELAANTGGIGHVVSVRRAAPRLERGRQVEVRDAQAAEIRHDGPSLAKAEFGRQLESVRRAELPQGMALRAVYVSLMDVYTSINGCVDSRHARRSNSMARSAIVTPPRARMISSSVFSGSAVERTRTQPRPKRRVGSVKVTGSK